MKLRRDWLLIESSYAVVMPALHSKRATAASFRVEEGMPQKFVHVRMKIRVAHREILVSVFLWGRIKGTQYLWAKFLQLAL